MQFSTMIDIGDVSKKTGLPISTLRYYEKKGLIKPIARHGLRRQYDRSILERLSLIILGRNAGFSLDEMRDMLNSNGTQIDREKLLHKAAEISKKIQKLEMMRNGLNHAASCTAPSHLECPKFQRIMHMAVRDNITKIDDCA